MIKRLLILCYILSFSSLAGAQVCGLAEEQYTINFSSPTVIPFEINNVINDDLADPGQGVCGVEISFEVSNPIIEYEISLISPAGQRITLMGPATQNFFLETRSLLNLKFVRNADPAKPDFGFPARWDNTIPNGYPSNFLPGYQGSYYPFDGQLEDYDTGPVNGEWRLVIENNIPFGPIPNTLFDLRITFCDEAGRDCCFASAGELRQDDLAACQNAPELQLDLPPSYPRNEIQPDETVYGYTYAISQGDTLLAIDDTPDLSSYPVGEYEVCGISYQLSERDLFPAPDDMLTMDSLRRNLQSADPFFCGDLSANCVLVTILPNAGPVSVQASICPGDTLRIGSEALTTAGIHPVILESTNGCDSLLAVNLSFLPSPVIDSVQTLCPGESILIGNSVYSTSGQYADTLQTVHGCDSIINLDLTVLSLLMTAVEDTICAGESYAVGDSLFTESGFYQVVLFANTGCDSTVNLNLTVLDASAAILPPGTITCASPEIILSAQSSSGNNLDYAWYDAGNNLRGQGASLVVDQAGDYYLETSLLQCSVRDTVTVVENLVAPPADAGPPDTLNCGSKAQLLIGSLATSQGADYGYAWSTDTGRFVGAADQRQVTVDRAGRYTLIVSDLRNGCTDTSAVAIAADTTPPTVEAGLNQLITCSNPVAVLDGSGSAQYPGLEYTWTALTGAIQLTADPLQPQTTGEGIFELTVRNPVNECSSSDRVAVFTDTTLPKVNIANPRVITCDQPEIRLNAQLIDGGNSPVISWMGPGVNSIVSDGNTLAPLVAEAGDYRLLVTNPGNGCTDSTQITVAADLVAPVIDFSPPDTLRCAGQLITLEYLTNADPAELAIQWLDPMGAVLGTAVSQEVTQAGLYQLEVRDRNNGCTSSGAIEVIDDSAPPVISFGDLLKSCDVDTFQITASLDRDPSLFSALWTGPDIISGADELSPLVGSPGEYVLTLTRLDIACSYIDTAIVTEPPCGPCLEADPAPSFTCRENDLQLEVRYCDDCVGCTIEWTTTDGQIRAGANTLTPIVGQAGTYTISVTDSFNITAQLEVKVTESRNYPVAEAGPDTTLTCRFGRIDIGSANSDNGAGFQTRWRSLSTGFTSLGNARFLAVDRSDTYILEIQNLASGCISRDTVAVGLDTIPPLAEAGPDGALTCLESTLRLDGSNSETGPGISYQWTATDGGQVDLDADTPTPQISAPGTYTLRVFNENNGCIASDVVSVSLDDTPPEINLPDPGLLTCTDTVIVLEPLNVDTTRFSYEWCALDGNDNPITCAAGPAYKAQSVGVYRLQVVNRQNGCSNTASVSVFQDRDPPLASAGPDATINCASNQVFLDGSIVAPSLQVSFAWSSPDGQIISGSDGPSPLIGGAGQYILLATNLSNGCTDRDTVLVTADVETPEARLVQDAGQLLLTCTEDTLLLDASSSLAGGNMGLDYFWTTDEDPGNLIGAGNLPTVQVVGGGAYYLMVQDRENGCRDTLSFQVNVNTIRPAISLSSTGSITCLQTEARLDAGNSETGPGIRHQWFRNEQLLPNSTLSFVVNQGGTYRLESTYLDNGCTSEAEVVIDEDTGPPQINIAPPVILDCDNPAARLDASATTGQALRFSWSTLDGNIVSGQSQAVATVNAPGLYSLQVVDGGNGCSARSSIEVNLTGLRIGRINLAITSPSCPGEADGSVRLLSVEGGTNPFVIALNDDKFITANEFSQLAPGTYQLTVMDAAGCEADTTLTLQEPESVQVSLGADQKIRKGEEVVLRVSTNVKEPQNIRWSPASLVDKQDTLVQILQPDRSATYRVEITDERGCMGSSEVQVTVSNETPVYISNAFSPNEDGENDRFFIQAGNAVTNIKSFRIFDRWGNAVFEAKDIPPNDPQLGWDGYYQGRLMNTAVFVYFAELELVGGDVEMVQGEVLLVK